MLNVSCPSLGRTHLSISEQHPVLPSVEVKNSGDDLRCNCNIVMYRCEGPDITNPIALIHLVYTWFVLRARGDGSIREILHGESARHSSTSLSRWTQCLLQCDTIPHSELLPSTTNVHRAESYFDPLRYPADIAQGIAVPCWACYNVTVSGTLTIW